MDPFHGIHGILCMVGSSSLDLFSSSSCSTHKSPNPTATNVLSKGRMLIVFSHLPNSNKWIEKRLEHWPRSEVKITIFENSPQRFGLKNYNQKPYEKMSFKNFNPLTRLLLTSMLTMINLLVFAWWPPSTYVRTYEKNQSLLHLVFFAHHDHDDAKGGSEVFFLLWWGGWGEYPLEDQLLQEEPKKAPPIYTYWLVRFQLLLGSYR